jgi:uncharacterized protein YggT (Ycf19 family)
MEPEQLYLIFGALAALCAAVVIAVAICAAFVMVMIGVVTISLIVGFSSGKVLSGLRALLVQLGVLAGAPVGAVVALVFAQTWPEFSHHGVILAMGGATGAFGGLVMALLAHRVVQMATARFPKLRLPRTTLIPSS